MSVPFPTPPMEGLHESSPTVSGFWVSKTVRAPDLAAPAAASQPACPPPMTQTIQVTMSGGQPGLNVHSPSYSFDRLVNDAKERKRRLFAALTCLHPIATINDMSTLEDPTCRRSSRGSGFCEFLSHSITSQRSDSVSLRSWQAGVLIGHKRPKPVFEMKWKSRTT